MSVRQVAIADFFRISVMHAPRLCFKGGGDERGQQSCHRTTRELLPVLWYDDKLADQV